MSIAWDDSMSVGIEKFDADHKKLLNIINKLEAASETSDGSGVLGAILGELVDYTKYHFTREEELLEKHDFHGLAGHKEQHDEFVVQIEEFLRQFVEEDKAMELCGDTLAFLERWLTKHIRGTDRDYASFLLLKGES